MSVSQAMSPNVSGSTKTTSWKVLPSDMECIPVYFELHETMPDAIAREKKLKRWRRAWKIALVEKDNPDWLDLYGHILE